MDYAGHHVISATTPTTSSTPLAVGFLWTDTSGTPTLKVCTSVSPVTFATISSGAVADSDITFSDITTGDVSITKHGFVPKAPNTTTQFLRGDAAWSTSGQIPFPATQNPSADANTLDDYEEGTWTPIIRADGGFSGQTYTTQTGVYVKNGQMVTVSFLMVLSNKGTLTGNVMLGGLPFSHNASVNAWMPLGWSGSNTNWVALVWEVAAGNTIGYLRPLTAASTDSLNPAAATADISNTFTVRGSFTYRASA
jgi:hypothetical protein